MPWCRTWSPAGYAAVADQAGYVPAGKVVVVTAFWPESTGPMSSHGVSGRRSIGAFALEVHAGHVDVGCGHRRHHLEPGSAMSWVSHQVATGQEPAADRFGSLPRSDLAGRGHDLDKPSSLPGVPSLRGAEPQPRLLRPAGGREGRPSWTSTSWPQRAASEPFSW
jgi:hypothetical protein